MITVSIWTYGLLIFANTLLLILCALYERKTKRLENELTELSHHKERVFHMGREAARKTWSLKARIRGLEQKLNRDHVPRDENGRFTKIVRDAKD